MIWKECVLKAKTDGEADALGNCAEIWETALTTKARLTPFDDTKTVLEQRTVTADRQYFAIPVRYALFPTCQKAEIDNRSYNIDEVIDLSPRYTVIGCSAYKGGAIAEEPEEPAEVE